MTAYPYAGLDAVVFDLDGTLADSLPDIAAALNVALAQAGLDTLGTAAVRRMVGGGARHLVQKAVTHGGRDPAPIAAVHDAFLAAYAASPCVQTTLYPGATEVLDGLARHGIRLGVCTNKPQAITDRVLAGLGLSGRFAAVVGGRDGIPLKPAPDMLRTALGVLAARSCASVMVGDSEADAGTARAVGTRLVLMRHGYSQQPLAGLGADAVVAGFPDLPQALMRMTR
jgi:phosphoglycolate phosphatase